MGHRSNPIGLRLTYSRSFAVKENPRVQPDNPITQILPTIYFGTRRFQRQGCIYSHCIVYKSHQIKANIFLYDSRFELGNNRCYAFIMDNLSNRRGRYMKKVKGTRASLNDIYAKYFHTAYKKRFFYLMRSFLFNNFRNVLWSSTSTRLVNLVAHRLGNNNPLTVTITLLHNATLTARAIITFALRKLQTRNRLTEIFNPIIRNLSYLFHGIVILCRGRFTRNQRATKTLFQRGSVKYSTYSHHIDFAQGYIPLKYGVGSLVIAINRKPKSNYRQ